MQKREALDSESAAPESGVPATPRVSGELSTTEPFGLVTPLPESSTRAAQSTDDAGAVSEPSDTLLSAGKPAHRLEILLEDRLAIVDDRINELDARLLVLEQQKPAVAAPVPAPVARQNPWLWLAFLIALVAAYQLLHALK